MAGIQESRGLIYVDQALEAVANARVRVGENPITANHMSMCWNWQTGSVEVAVPERVCGFEAHLAHHLQFILYTPLVQWKQNA